jgi:hypothetical protein
LNIIIKKSLLIKMPPRKRETDEEREAKFNTWKEGAEYA